MPVPRRTLGALVAACAALALGAVPAAADPAGGANNVVIAQTSTDGASLARATTEVVPFGGDTLTSANIANATTSDCTGCHAAAVAVQVVFATGSPSYVAPANVAAATTAGCNGCGAYAYAWQYVIETSGPAHLSPAAAAAVADLRGRIADAAASITPSDRLTDPCFTADGPPYPCTTRDEQLDAKLDDLTAQLKSVIDDGIQTVGVTSARVRVEARATP